MLADGMSIGVPLHTITDSHELSPPILGVYSRSLSSFGTTYVDSLFRKLNALSRTEAIALANRRGLLRV